MSASAARSISVTMSVALDFVVMLDRAWRQAIEQQRAGLLSQLGRENEERGEVERLRSRPLRQRPVCHGFTVGPGGNLPE